MAHPSSEQCPLRTSRRRRLSSWVRGTRLQQARSPSGAPPRLSPKPHGLGSVRSRASWKRDACDRLLPGQPAPGGPATGPAGRVSEPPERGCETARGHRARSALQIASGQRPSASERRAFYPARTGCQALSPISLQQPDSALLFARPFAARAPAAARKRANQRASVERSLPHAFSRGSSASALPRSIAARSASDMASSSRCLTPSATLTNG